MKHKQAPKPPGKLHPDHADAHSALLRAIEAVGGQVPCVQAERNPWTSEHKASQRDAIQLCYRCPVITQCRDYGIQYETSGVWGGRIRNPQPLPEQGELKW